MPGRLPVAVTVLLLLSLSSVLEEADAAGKVAGTLSLRDALTAPGRPVMIEARLVRAGVLGQTGLETAGPYSNIPPGGAATMR